MKLSNPGLIYNRVACSIHNSSIRHSILRPSFKLYHSQLDTDQNAATGCNGSEYLIFVTLSEPGGHLALSDFRDCAFSNDFPGAIQSAPGHGVSKFLEAAISIETLRTLAPAMTGFRISGTATSPPPSGVSDQIGPPATYSFPADSGFLIFPLEITCGKGVPCTPYTAKVSTVLDHHVVRTAANPIGYNCQREQLPPGECEDDDFKSKVIAFNGEEGNSEFGTLCFPAGYKMDKDETRFFKNKEINYVATNCGGTKYLKYDGHSGYDFSYDNVPILAAADGI